MDATGNSRLRLKLTMTGIILFFSGTVALANGGAFFDEQAADSRAQFFGVVKDTKGNTLRGAQVIIRCEKAKVSVVVQTNAIGHYFFAGFPKEIDPKETDVSCSKDGYKFVSSLKRPPVGKVTPTSPVETNCTLQGMVD